MKNRDAAKLAHERAVTDQLLKALKMKASFERHGDADEVDPDVIYQIDGAILGIEVATAYYEDSDAKDAWVIARGEKPLPPDEIRARSAGVLVNPDRTICDRVQAELENKCRKKYGGAEEIWLCINLDAALSDATSVRDCVKNLRVPGEKQFARIYLTYTAPVHEGGRYTPIRLA